MQYNNKVILKVTTNLQASHRNAIQNLYDPFGIVTHDKFRLTRVRERATSQFRGRMYLPLLFSENGRTLVLDDLFVGVYADDQIMAQSFGLS